MKKIENYIHLYIGSYVMFCAIEGVPYKCKLLGVTTDSEGAHRIQLAEIEDDGELGSIFWDHLEFIDPLLRPLDSMTERDASDIVSALPGMVVENCYSFLQDWIDGRSILITFETQISLTNEMRKRGFDCDSLIPDGIALNRNTI